MEKDEPVTFLHFTGDAYIMVATGTEHEFLKLSFLRFRDGRPSGPTLQTFLSVELTPFDFCDHWKVVPSAKPHPVQKTACGAYVLRTRDVIELFLTNP